MEKKWTAQEMGRKGGKISKRVLTAEQARAMVIARERKKHVENQISSSCDSEKIN